MQAAPSSKRAFSLIELTAVILILAIVAAAVALRVQTPMRHARLGDATGAIGQFDRMTRRAAREQDRPLRMVVALPAWRLSRTDERGRATSPPMVLPSGTIIEQLLVRDQSAASAEVAISCSRLGLTPTYAMLVSSGGERRWIVVAGLTGEVVEVKSEQEVHEIIEATAARHNAR